ncbi:hypothetical protein F8M41_021184 [Gigaspora margarita]|uniref:Uncharacterized protein n=1 Tax=Gigaspora margarita TaxID=4874 RepID=A0A8H4AH91_GIGMA|nr:hypothetical protein F8M41_021184 [Gigaspora margarita]
MFISRKLQCPVKLLSPAEISRLDYFAEKSTWNLLGFLEWSAVNFKKDFGSKDEEHLTYKISLETIKNKPEILLFRDSFTEEFKSIEVKPFWENCPALMDSLTKAINLTSTRMVSRVSVLHDDLSNTIYTETRDQISSFSKRKKNDSLQNNGKKLHLDQTENSHIMKEMMGNTLKERNNVEDDSPDRKKLLPIKVETNKEKLAMKKRSFMNY